MSSEPEKYLSSFVRSYENTEFLIKLYGSWTVLILLLLGFYGIRPLLVSIKEKSAMLNEMQTAKTNLIANTETLKNTRSELYRYRTNIDSLNSYMPASPEIQTYILELISAVGNQGYIMRSFSQFEYSDDPNTIELHVQTDGATYPADMIKDIEQLKRVTNVKSATLIRQELSTRVQYKVTLVLHIYKQPQ